MPQTCEQFADLLTAASAGDFDALSPEQIEQLEAHVNACPACAERLGDATPTPDPALDALKQVGAGTGAPTPEVWENVWDGIEAGRLSDSAPQPVKSRRSLLRRIWKPLTAAAACLMVAAVWRATTGPWTVSPAVQLSTNVEVHELEVFGDETAIVFSMDSNNGAAVIWVLDEQGV